MPVQIIHYVTARCNLRCEHCFYKETLDAPNPGEMSLETTERTVMEIGPVLWYSLAGGEPFLRGDLVDVICLVQKHCRPKVFSFPTNGWFVERTFLSTLRALQRMDRGNLILFFSLDGPESIHDEIRGKGSYSKVMETIERLRPLQAMYPSLYLNVVTTVTPQNAPVVTEFVDYLVREVRPNAVSINLFRYHSLDHPPIPEEVVDAYDSATRAYGEHLQRGALDHYGFVGRRVLVIKELLQKELILRVAREDAFVTPCMAGTLSYVINEDGTVAACEILAPEQTIGSIDGTQRSGQSLRAPYLDERESPVTVGREYNAPSLDDTPDRKVPFSEMVRSDDARNLRKWIRETECRCTYECAMSTNTLFSWPLAGRLYGRLAKSLVTK
jgi:MoaA/NifB/PqqE/SkfB family radical SAM enzyme